MSELKRNSELVSKWYESYYIWNSAVLHTSMANHDAHVLKNPAASSSNTTTTRSNSRVSNIPNYKLPPLHKRILAEVFDWFIFLFLRIFYNIITSTNLDVILQNTKTSPLSM